MSGDTLPPTDVDVVAAPATVASTSINRTPPSMFAVLRSGGGGLERLSAASLDDAVSTIKRQVANSQNRIVYIYQLVGAEVFVPTSESISVDQIEPFLKNDGAWPIPDNLNRAVDVDASTTSEKRSA